MQTSEIIINPHEYDLIARLVYDRFGINLGPQKQSLVTNRLRKVLLEKSFKSFKQYYDYIIHDKSGNGLDTLINGISTNLTYFARENEHFSFLQNKVLPNLLKNKSIQREKSLRIWCAGCSTGEEAYTIAMVLHKLTGIYFSDWDLGVLGTDISAKALKTATKAVYKSENVTKLDALFQKIYLKKIGKTSYTIKPLIRDLVLFRRLNLMRSNFPFKRKFHVIFCRNVMIYFDAETRKKLIERFYSFLENDGYLFIGHSESLGRSNEFFEYIKPAVYRKMET